MPHPRFKISKNDGGEYSFNLTAANAEKILASERYTTRSSAEGGIEAVKANAQIRTGRMAAVSDITLRATAA